MCTERQGQEAVHRTGIIAASNGTKQMRRLTSYLPSHKPLMSSAGCWTHHSLRMLSCSKAREGGQCLLGHTA